jgi:hypothetical protein
MSRQLTQAERKKILDKIRQRFRKTFQMICIGVALGYALVATMHQLEAGSRVDAYHELCRSLEVGQDVSALRGIASERQLLFEEDPDFSRVTNDQVYVIRPDADWSRRYGCRFTSREARVLKVHQHF